MADPTSSGPVFGFVDGSRGPIDASLTRDETDHNASRGISPFGEDELFFISDTEMGSNCKAQNVSLSTFHHLYGCLSGVRQCATMLELQCMRMQGRIPRGDSDTSTWFAKLV